MVGTVMKRLKKGMVTIQVLFIQLFLYYTLFYEFVRAKGKISICNLNYGPSVIHKTETNGVTMKFKRMLLVINLFPIVLWLQ